jgi:serine/threonine-protein kinase
MNPQRQPRTSPTRSFFLAVLVATALFSGCSLGPTQASVEQPVASPLQFIGAWGVKGTDPGQLDQPTSIATDVRGNVYIADAGSQFIHKFQPGGTPLLSFQDPSLKHPQSIAVDRGGAIYVSDPVRASVFVFLPDGTRYREIRLQIHPSAENTLDVAVADDGSMAVLDVSAAKIYEFSPRFRLQHVWKPGIGPTSGPGRPHSVISGPADAIYLGGFAANTLLRYDEGKIVSQINLAGGFPTDRVGDQFALSSKYIFLADPDGKTLHVWTLDGKSKTDLDFSPQLGDAQRVPPPIAVSPMGDLLILDTQQARVLRYRINL